MQVHNIYLVHKEWKKSLQVRLIMLRRSIELKLAKLYQPFVPHLEMPLMPICGAVLTCRHGRRKGRRPSWSKPARFYTE